MGVRRKRFTSITDHTAWDARPFEPGDWDREHDAAATLLLLLLQRLLQGVWFMVVIGMYLPKCTR